MKNMKKYILLPFTLVFIIMGAAMPYLISRIQDTQINESLKKMKLSHVSLTLRKEGDFEPALRLISKPHTENYWDGKTMLTKAEAISAALKTLETLSYYGLIPKKDLNNIEKSVSNSDSYILFDDDGNSSLIWLCTWDYGKTFITIDDATGKAIRILINNTAADGISEAENVYYELDKWTDFLQDYYDVELEVVESGAYRMNQKLSAQFDIKFSSKYDSSYYDLSLELSNISTFFNYCQSLPK